MTALLDLPEVRERVHRVTVPDYHRLGQLGVISEDVELLRGIIVDKMSKSPLHEFIAQKLMKLFARQIPEKFEVRREGPLTLADSEPEPDISIVEGKPEDWLNSHPSRASVVIEIAISSLHLDRSKAEIYAEAAIPEYWLIRGDEYLVDVYRQPTNKGYVERITLTANDTLKCGSIAELQIDLKEIFPQ